MNSAKVTPEDRSKRGPDFLQLDASEAAPGALATWLTGRLRQAVADGTLPTGSRLPASRVLAGELGVSRGVVTEAYRRLADDGHVRGRGRAGTIVIGLPGSSAPLPAPSSGPSPAGAPSSGPLRGRSAAQRVPVVPIGPPGKDVFDALRAAPARVDLSPGTPDLAAFPRTEWLRAERAVLAELSPAAFGYGDPRGTPVLREQVAMWLARNRGIRVSPDEVLIVSGVAQALALVARMLHDSGVDAVAVEDPGSLGARQQLQSWGVSTPPVLVDEAGVRVDELRACGAPAVMLTPAHQLPTGVVLDGERRRELRAWARDGGLIIEDDYDAEHRYDRAPVPALRATLAERVCYTGSISKLLAPALRIGWLLAPAEYRDALIGAKRDSDLGNAVLAQLVLAELMRSGGLERHLRFVRARHRRRRDAMIRALARAMPEATVHGAAAGLHLLVTFGADVSDVELARAALARGIKLQPLSWHAQLPGRQGLVLGYAARSPGEIDGAIAVIGELLAARR